ncbi:helix-turn-helix domain-containing protein [Streptomyces malaysiensis]|uniref:helix-turn-helix domain-containing protein n=1 Tax=Streptomyces malaysiensis TaxID=92644 RepID=UPI0036CCD3C9
MNVRADIAALIQQDHTDEYIARQINCHRSTVNRARNILRRAVAEPSVVERLYAEALPTGQVADYRPERMPTSKAQAAANRARLEAALREDRATSRLTPAYRHLHAVDTRKAA